MQKLIVQIIGDLLRASIACYLIQQNGFFEPFGWVVLIGLMAEYAAFYGRKGWSA